MLLLLLSNITHNAHFTFVLDGTVVRTPRKTLAHESIIPKIQHRNRSTCSTRTMAQASQSTFNTHLASVESLQDKAGAGPGATDTSLATYDNAPPNVPNTDSSSQETRREVEAKEPAVATEDGSKEAVPPGGAFSATHGGRSKGKIALIMSALCMAVFLAALDVTIITTALPTISGRLSESVCKD